MGGGATSADYAAVTGMVAAGPIALLVAWAASRTRGPVRPSEVEPVSVAAPRRRVLYFDFWRIGCVICVVVVHGDDAVADWNIAAGQQWILQIIMVISGTCYGMSRGSCSHLLHYQSRLLAIVSLGSLLNLAACEVAEVEWWHDILLLVGFQVMFVGLINCASLLSFPLKLLLDEAPSICQKLTMCFYVVVTAGFAGIWALFVVLEGRTDMETSLRGSTISCGLLLAAAVGTCVLPQERRGVTGWIVLILLYLAQVLTKNPEFGYWAHLVDIYNWSFFVQRVPLLGDHAVGLILARAWPIWAVCGGVIGCIPGERGRRDKYPFEDACTRARFYCLEVLFMLAFVTIPKLGPERTIPVLEALRPHLAWLNAWSLLAFCAHQAVYYLLENKAPWGLIVVFSSALPFYAVWRLCAHRRGLKLRGQRPSDGQVALAREVSDEMAIEQGLAVPDLDPHVEGYNVPG